MHQSDKAELEVISCGPDWLTATAKPGLRHAILSAAALRWITDRAKDGNQERPFAWQGYVGQAIDGITFGERSDGSLLRLSGDLAAEHTPTAVTWVSNVSRLDLQVTVRDDDSTRDWAEIALGCAALDQRVRNGMTRTSLIRSTPSGVTFYCGSRSSDRYFRVYDKTAESKGAYPERSWRFEIEYKKARALRVAEHLRDNLWSPQAVAAVVSQSFADYGVTLPYKAFRSAWRDTTPRTETNDERRIAWLQSSIRPMIERMSEAFPRSVLLEALGLGGDLDVFTGELFTSPVESCIPHPTVPGAYLVSDG